MYEADAYIRRSNIVFVFFGSKDVGNKQRNTKQLRFMKVLKIF